MANNYYPPPGAYGTPFGAPPPFNRDGEHGQMPTFPPAPGMQAPPGMPQTPVGMPPQFQPPPDMPNINFNAPVMRFETRGGPAGDRMGGARGRESSNAEPLGNRGRMGLGADAGRMSNLERDRAQLRENMANLHYPTREETFRTIAIHGLDVPGLPNDEQIEALLRCAGKLRRWARVKEGDGRKVPFGFAEYEDVESLHAANEIFEDIDIPLVNKAPTAQIKQEDTEDGTQETKPQTEKEMHKIHMTVDEQSKKYMDEWMGRKKESDLDRQFRIDGCKEAAQQVIASMVNASAFNNNAAYGYTNGGNQEVGFMGNGVENVEIANITIPLDDDLADVPAEMRQTVADEIRAFRERSTIKDQDRARRQEELEQAERQRSGANARGAPSGPASASNGIPVGPRGPQGVQGAPSGPRGFRGQQVPNDQPNGSIFVPGAGPFGMGVTISINRDEEYAEESDEELERRRKAREDAEVAKRFQEQLRRWTAREAARDKALSRETNQEKHEDEIRAAEKAKALARLAAYNDDEEEAKGRDEYYRDRSAWLRRREIVREQEKRDDEKDRQAEEREAAEQAKREAEARGQADNFLESLGNTMDQAAQQQPTSGFGGFRIQLGGAAKKIGGGQAQKVNAMAEVEGLLEDEEDAADAGFKRTLKPLTDLSTVPIDLTDEEKKKMQQDLAKEIPTDTKTLFDFEIDWTQITSEFLGVQLKPFVERKVMEYLGVQEGMMVDAILTGVQNHKKPGEMVSELESALDEESEALIKKVWRMVVFASESGKRGLN